MRISVRHIQERVAEDFGVPKSAFFSDSQKHDEAHSRQAAMLLARELTPHSLTVLGRLFDRDHTTIIHGIKSAKKRIAEDRNLALRVEARKLLLQCDPAIHCPRQLGVGL